MTRLEEGVRVPIADRLATAEAEAIFVGKVEEMMKNGFSLIPHFVDSQTAAGISEEIYGGLGTVFRNNPQSRPNPAMDQRLPTVAQLRKTYNRLTKKVWDVNPVFRLPVGRVDIFQYSHIEGFERHNDPREYGPIIFSLTVQGSARATIWSEEGFPEDLMLEAGDLWLLRGGGLNMPLLEHKLSPPRGPHKRIAIVMNGLVGGRDPYDSSSYSS